MLWWSPGPASHHSNVLSDLPSYYYPLLFDSFRLPHRVLFLTFIVLAWCSLHWSTLHYLGAHMNGRWDSTQAKMNDNELMMMVMFNHLQFRRRAQNIFGVWYYHNHSIPTTLHSDHGESTNRRTIEVECECHGSGLIDLYYKSVALRNAIQGCAVQTTNDTTSIVEVGTDIVDNDKEDQFIAAASRSMV